MAALCCSGVSAATTGCLEVGEKTSLAWLNACCWVASDCLCLLLVGAEQSVCDGVGRCVVASDHSLNSPPVWCVWGGLENRFVSGVGKSINGCLCQAVYAYELVFHIDSEGCLCPLLNMCQ